jgi:hypothetical protein
MDTVFPFGFPGPTAFYLTFYVLTLIVHVVFMNYVVAGAAYLAWSGLRHGAGLPRPDVAQKSPASVVLDWLPVMLSGAITAGVAPLLFVQLLYQQGFYTANLLLFNRWMSILPVLIVGFYALYLLRGDWLRRRAGWVVAVMAAVPFLCVAFTGWSWTENHLLSLREPAFWGAFYGTERQVYHEPQLVPRLLVWTFGALPTFAVILGWQLGYLARHGQAELAKEGPWLARLALAGLALVLAAGLAYAAVAGETTRAAFVGPMAWPFFALAILGLIVQAAAWVGVLRSGTIAPRPLALASAGLLLTVVGMSACREAVRLLTLGEERLAALYPQHARVFEKGGLAAFLFFFLLNAGLVTLCFVLVHRGRRPLIT